MIYVVVNGRKRELQHYPCCEVADQSTDNCVHEFQQKGRVQDGGSRINNMDEIGSNKPTDDCNWEKYNSLIPLADKHQSFSDDDFK